MLNIKCICPPWVKVIKPADTEALLQSVPFFARVAWEVSQQSGCEGGSRGYFSRGCFGGGRRRDRQSRKLAFFIATAKSASENSIDVPRESFDKRNPHTPSKNHTTILLKYLNISLSWQELFLFCLSTQNDRICSPSLGRRLHRLVYLVCLLYCKSLKGLESLKPKSLKTCRSFLWKVLTNGLQRPDSLLHSNSCFFYQ